MVLKLIAWVAKRTTVEAPAHGWVGPESSLASLRLHRRLPEAWEEEKSVIEVLMEIPPPIPMKT